jgi:hypothetical protein
MTAVGDQLRRKISCSGRESTCSYNYRFANDT